MARNVPISDPAELSNCGFSSEFEAVREINTQTDFRGRELENLGRTVIDLIADAYPDWHNKGVVGPRLRRGNVRPGDRSWRLIRSAVSPSRRNGEPSAVTPGHRYNRPYQ